MHNIFNLGLSGEHRCPLGYLFFVNFAKLSHIRRNLLVGLNFTLSIFLIEQVIVVFFHVRYILILEYYYFDFVKFYDFPVSRNYFCLSNFSLCSRSVLLSTL